MAKGGFTAIAVTNAKPARDGAGQLMSLYLVIQPGGAKSWALRYRYKGKPRKLTLGPALLLERGEAEPWGDPAIDGSLTLAAARMLASDALRKVGQGTDPAEQKKQETASTEAEQTKLAGDTVENLKSQFIERYAKRQNRSWKQTEWIFDKLVLPAWKDRTVHEITKRDVIDLIEGIEQDRPILANRVLAAVRKWFNWLAARDVVKASPCAGVVPPAKEKARDRARPGRRRRDRRTVRVVRSPLVAYRAAALRSSRDAVVGNRQEQTRLDAF
jgi:Arm DNA-binding domain